MAYGCFNREPFKQVTAVLDGVSVLQFGDSFIVRPELRTIPFRMSPDCQYTHTTLGQADTGCIGCKHKETQ
jgi:hypothetical protein